MASARATWLTLTIVTLAAGIGACADEGVVGENTNLTADSGVAMQTGADGCVQRSTEATLPADENLYTESPALWVEGARGVWSSSAGDTLEVQIAQQNTRVQRNCVEQTGGPGQTPEAPGGYPQVSFELTGEITLHTADGAWDETMEARFDLLAAPPQGSASAILRGQAVLPFAMLAGTFELPSNLVKKPADRVQIGLTYQRSGWILTRSLQADRTLPDGGTMPAQTTGDYAPVWMAEPMAFVRR